MSEPSELVADPNTPPEVLGRLAYEYPELQPQVVVHPSVYVELLQWISSRGTPAGRAAAADRLSPPQVRTVPPPAPPAAPAAAPPQSGGSAPVHAPARDKLSASRVQTADRRAASKKSSFLWTAVAVVLVLALAVGLIRFSQYRAVQSMDVRAEEAVAELDAAIEATVQAEERVKAALDELDRESSRHSGLSVDALEMHRHVAGEMLGPHFALSEARGAAARAKKPGLEAYEIFFEADSAPGLENEIAALDELTEEIEELTAELSEE